MSTFEPQPGATIRITRTHDISGETVIHEGRVVRVDHEGLRHPQCELAAGTHVTLAGPPGWTVMWETLEPPKPVRPEEPANRTMWLDPVANDLWIRDDSEDRVDRKNWYRSGDLSAHTWERAHSMSPDMIPLIAVPDLADLVAVVAESVDESGCAGPCDTPKHARARDLLAKYGPVNHG